MFDNLKSTALRDVTYAISMAIDLLHILDIARAQLVKMTAGEDVAIVIPGNALGLNAAVERATKSCREII